MLRSSYLIILILICTLKVDAVITTATSTGNWSNSSTWDNGVPGCGDTIIISSIADVTVTSHLNLDEPNGCSIPIHLKIDGNLGFNTGRKMYLPCNSFVEITSSGSLSKGGGGGNSNVIDICQNTVWNAAAGNQGGPTSYGTGTGLPITLVEFNAINKSYGVELNWKTASEINNDFFTVERSSNGTLFEEILIIQGAGNSNSLLNYSAIDDNPLSGTSYYRLKQTDYDGKFSYSDLKTANRDEYSFANIVIFPNPSNGSIKIKSDVSFTKKVMVKIYDNTGRTIRVLNVGLNDIIDLYDLQSGIYVLHLLNENGDLMNYSKFILENH